MQCVYRWATLSALVLAPSFADAQQSYRPAITPNYGMTRSSEVPEIGTRVAWNDQTLPSPSDSVSPIGSGIPTTVNHVDAGQPLTITPSGSVDYGTYDVGPTPTTEYVDAGDSYSPMIMDTGHPHGGWFAGLYYLNLSRADDNRSRVLAYDDLDTTVPVLSTGVHRMEAASGFGVRLGKMLTASTAIEGIYWRVFPDDVSCTALTTSGPGNLNSTLLFNGLDYDNLAGGGAQPVDSFFQATQLLQVERTYDYQNAEINFLRLPFVFAGGTSRARLALLGGVRYFRGDESLTYWADFNDTTLGNDPANELRYKNRVENNLVGFQMGGLLDYCLTQRLSGQIGSKFGIFNNRMNIRQSVVGGAGGAIINTGSYAGQPFGVISKKDDLALLAELDAGLAYAVNCNWRITGGYRVIAVSSYADSVSQIPSDFTDLGSAAYINNNDSLILHGAYAGVEYTW